MTSNSRESTPTSRVNSIEDMLLARKQHMHLEQKALLYDLRQHLEHNPDINYRHTVQCIKNGLQAHVDLMEQIKASHQELPWAVKTSKHVECQQAVVALFDQDVDQGAGSLQDFFVHNRLKDWAWQDADNQDFPVLGGTHGHGYWGTPHTTRVSALLLHAHHALGLDYAWDKPSSIHYHYPIPASPTTIIQKPVTTSATGLGYALKELEQTLGQREQETTDQSLQLQAVTDQVSADQNQDASEQLDAHNHLRQRRHVNVVGRDFVAVSHTDVGQATEPNNTEYGVTQDNSSQASHRLAKQLDNPVSDHNSEAGNQVLPQAPSFFNDLRMGGVDIIHSGFCFGGAGELLSDYSGHDYPPHDCSSSVSLWFECPFRVSTVDQYLLSVYPRPVSWLGWLNLAPVKWMVPRLDRLSLFDGKLQRAQQLAETLVSVPNEDVQPGDMYVMRITKPKPNWTGYFFGHAGHTAMVKQASTDKPGYVDTIEFSRAIEDGIEGFGSSQRPLFPEVRPNGNQVSHTLLRKL